MLIKFVKKLVTTVLIMILVIGIVGIGYSYADSKISASRYNIILNCKTNKLGYFKDGKMVKEFPVATGKASTPTPKGKFKIVNKIKNRPYYSGGIPGGSPKNPLGDRWLGLKVGFTYGTTYAIHGNNNESSIGKYVSGGCIRMHNKDVRWLFDQIPVGTMVVIYNSNDSYVQAAKKYGINLVSNEELNNKQKEVKNRFKEFAIYGPINNPIIDLRDKNSIISDSKQADGILRTYSGQNPTDRQLFMNAWNNLSSQEKQHLEMKKIWSDYEKIISIVEAAQGCTKFYENVKLNTSDLLANYAKARNLNSISSLELGERGKAKIEYDEATNYGENSSNSKRMEYMYNIYLDATNLLDLSSSLENRDVDSARSKIQNIKDVTLRNVAKNAIDNYSDIKGHWAEASIRNAMNKGWVNNSNVFSPNNSTTRAEFIIIINNAFGFNNKATISFKDVKSDQWFYEHICTAFSSGYINGYEDNTFRPNNYITRQEAASIITSIINNKDSNLDKLSVYADRNKVSNWAKSSVEGSIEAGYMGVGSNTFNPKSYITRSETIVTIERVVK